jgi:hypothetical protein
MSLAFVYTSKSFFIRCKILRHGASGFTSLPKEGVLSFFIALKNLSPRPGLNPRTLSTVASTLTTTPPSRLQMDYRWTDRLLGRCTDVDRLAVMDRYTGRKEDR